ncbi:hypothetical protein KAW08_05310 [bacterium]|nr:hypothetical protein [bacterium]
MRFEDALLLLDLKPSFSKKKLREAYRKNVAKYSSTLSAAFTEEERERASDTIGFLKEARDICLTRVNKPVIKPAYQPRPQPLPRMTPLPSVSPQPAAASSYYVKPGSGLSRVLLIVEKIASFIVGIWISIRNTVLGFIYMIRSLFSGMRIIFRGLSPAVPKGVIIVTLILGIYGITQVFGVATHSFRAHARQRQSGSYVSRAIPLMLKREYSYLILRSWPSAKVRIGRRKINTPSRETIKVKPGKRKIVFDPINPQLRKVEIVYDFTGGTKYQVLANCETGNYQIKKVN